MGPHERPVSEPPLLLRQARRRSLQVVQDHRAHEEQELYKVKPEGSQQKEGFLSSVKKFTSFPNVTKEKNEHLVRVI